MESPTHIERDRSLGPGLESPLPGHSDRFDVPTDHDLARSVVIRGHYGAVLDALADLPNRVRIQADHGRHRTGTDRTRLRHEFAAPANQPNRILERQGTRGEVSGELAQRMTGANCHTFAYFLRKAGPHGVAVQQNRRLGVLGARQFFLGALPTDPPEVGAQYFVGPLESISRTGVALGKLPAHTHELRALTRHQKSDAVPTHCRLPR